MKTQRFLFAALLVVFFCGTALDALAAKVGISLPDETPRWTRDGEHMRHLLQTAGYDVELLYAGNDPAAQSAQITSLLKSRSAALIVAPVEGAALAPALAPARQRKVPVISLEDLIMDSTAITALVTFDIRETGRLQGAFIRDALRLDSAERPVLIELFSGPESNAASILHFDGAMDVLAPYFNTGKLRIKSKQITMDKCGVQENTMNDSRSRMSDLVTRFGYGPTEMPPLDAILSPDDTTSQGIIETLRAFGYKPGKGPVLTGLMRPGDSLEGVRNVLYGLQAMTVFEDSLALAVAAVELTDAALTRSPLPTTPGRDYHNGAIPLPARVISPVVVTPENYRQVLIDPGYFTEKELQQ